MLLNCARALLKASKLSETASKELLDKTAKDYLTASGANVEQVELTPQGQAKPADTTLDRDAVAAGDRTDRHRVNPGQRSLSDEFYAEPFELRARTGKYEQDLRTIREELDETFVDGIIGIIDPRKARVFSSSWN